MAGKNPSSEWVFSSPGWPGHCPSGRGSPPQPHRVVAKSAWLRRFFCIGRKSAIRPLPCSHLSAKRPARLACSVASALPTARCRYHLFPGGGKAALCFIEAGGTRRERPALDRRSPKSAGGAGGLPFATAALWMAKALPPVFGESGSGNLFLQKEKPLFVWKEDHRHGNEPCIFRCMSI